MYPPYMHDTVLKNVLHSDTLSAASFNINFFHDGY